MLRVCVSMLAANWGLPSANIPRFLGSFRDEDEKGFRSTVGWSQRSRQRASRPNQEAQRVCANTGHGFAQLNTHHPAQVA